MKKRSTTWILLAVVAVGLLASLLVVGGCIVWLQGDVESERTLLFAVDDGSAAGVYIGGKLVGTTPLQLTHEELEAFFQSYTGEWPPAGTSLGTLTVIGSYEEHEADFEPGPGESADYIWYLLMTQDGISEMQTLRYRVEAAGGRRLLRTGTSSSSMTAFRIHKTDHEFLFH